MAADYLPTYLPDGYLAIHRDFADASVCEHLYERTVAHTGGRIIVKRSLNVIDIRLRCYFMPPLPPACWSHPDGRGLFSSKRL